MFSSFYFINIGLLLKLINNNSDIIIKYKIQGGVRNENRAN